MKTKKSKKAQHVVIFGFLFVLVIIRGFLLVETELFSQPEKLLLSLIRLTIVPASLLLNIIFFYFLKAPMVYTVAFLALNFTAVFVDLSWAFLFLPILTGLFALRVQRNVDFCALPCLYGMSVLWAALFLVTRDKTVDFFRQNILFKLWWAAVLIAGVLAFLCFVLITKKRGAPVPRRQAVNRLVFVFSVLFAGFGIYYMIEYKLEVSILSVLLWGAFAVYYPQKTRELEIKEKTRTKKRRNA